MKKLEHSEYVKRLKGRKIKVIGKYINNKCPIDHLCLEKRCGYQWKAAPSDILKGTGCPECWKKRYGDHLRDSPGEFLKKIKGSNWILLDKYINSRTKNRFCCKKCNNQEVVVAQRISGGYECKNCKMIRTMEERTNKYRDDVKKYKIVPLEKVERLTNRIMHKCLVCGKEFKGCPKDIKSGKTGCNYCRKKSRIENSRKSHEDFERDLVDGIIIHGMYTNSITKIKVECSKCGYMWDAIPANIEKPKPGSKRRSTGCPKCSGRLKFNIDIYKKSLVPKKIKLIGNPTDANDKIKHLCLVCNNQWNVKPTTINQGHGCRVCAAAKVGKKRRLDPEKIEKILYSKKIKLLTSYEGVGKKHLLKCLNEECNHIWEATLTHLIYDELAGCPKCSRGGQSLGEKIFEDFLIKEKIEKTHPYKPPWLKTNRHFDFYIPEKNLFVEIDGEQHFRPSGGHFGGEKGFKETRRRDIEKMEKAFKRGYSILRITNNLVKRKPELLHILMTRNYKGLSCMGKAYYKVKDFLKYNPTFIKY